jgi:hypothetical protein
MDWNFIVLEPLPLVPNFLLEVALCCPITLKRLTSISPIGPRPIVASYDEVVSLHDGRLRAALHLEARLIPLEVDCMKFQPLLGWRPASTTHYNKNIITWANFAICKGLRAKKPCQFNISSITQGN